MIWIKDGEPEEVCVLDGTGTVKVQKLYSLIDDEGNSPSKKIMEAGKLAGESAKVVEIPVYGAMKVYDLADAPEDAAGVFVAKTKDYRVLRSELHLEAS